MSNKDTYDGITITLSPDDYESGDSYIWSGSGSDTITLSSLTDCNTVIGGASITGINIPWSDGTSVSTGWTTTGAEFGPTWANQSGGKIVLDGEGADIEVNGESLMGMLHRIEDRLNILKPDPSLEKEWEELKALGDQYRALEKHIREKQATWDKLKAMPPPEID